MAEPLENVRVGMTGRYEVVVTPELTVGAHLDGMPFVFSTPMMILAMEMASAAAVAPSLPAVGRPWAAKSTFGIWRPARSGGR